MGEGQSFAVFSPYSDGEEFYYALDWGQRHHDNRDRGKKLPYFFRRRRGKQLDSFVTIFHSYFGEKPLVKDVSVMERPEGVVATVKTALGEDTFLFAAEGTSLGAGRLSSDAEIAVALDNGQGRGALAMFKGRHFQAGEFQLTCETPAYQGRVARFVNKKQEAYFVLEGNIPPHADWAGHTLIARGQDGIDRPYQIRKSAWQNGEFLVYTRVDGYGLPVHAAETWLMPNRACVEF